MSFFGDIEFFMWLTVMVIPAIVLGLLEKPLKIYGLLVSVLLLIYIMWNDYHSLLNLGVFYIVELILVKSYCLLRQRFGRNGKIYGCFVFLSIVPVILDKISEVSSLSLFQFLGISYLTFR
ncbi:MAG: D-alanyl-lipoteichoic acid biosynthesis protein DltB, partial [Anaerovorax sp.]